LASALFVSLAAVAAAFAVAAGSAVAATPAGGDFAVAGEAALARWTPVRRAAARPLAMLRIADPERAGSAQPLARAAGVEGIDTGDPTLFPNRANGAVFGEYPTATGVELYQCSGSVIESPAGNVVLTAGHCVIDPETGDVARSVVFVPGYREGSEPYGAFAAESWSATPEWEQTAGAPEPDEAGDLAMLRLAPGTSDGASVEATVGGLSIAFETSREQTYTQWGYPGEAPYDGEILYSHTTPFAGVDRFYPAATAPIKIASDFTAGASGGPWTVGPATDPTVVSLTDYAYEFDPGHVYGAWFGAAARGVYEEAAGVTVPPATAAGGLGAAPVEGPPAQAVVAPAEAEPRSTASTPAGPPATTRAGAGHLAILATRGPSAAAAAAVVVTVDGPGKLRLTGAAVRTVSVEAPAGGNYRLPVTAKKGGSAARALGRRGTAKVGVWISFVSSAGVRRAWHLVRLVDPRHSRVK
jgi:V8-like Glu-specific endopeptidase